MRISISRAENCRLLAQILVILLIPRKLHVAFWLFTLEAFSLADLCPFDQHDANFSDYYLGKFASSFSAFSSIFKNDHLVFFSPPFQQFSRFMKFRHSPVDSCSCLNAELFLCSSLILVFSSHQASIKTLEKSFYGDDATFPYLDCKYAGKNGKKGLRLIC